MKTKLTKEQRKERDRRYHREYQKQWAAAHPEKIAQYRLTYWQKRLDALTAGKGEGREPDARA